MTNTWKEDLAWKSGLLSEIPVSRWRSIHGSEHVAILVFKRRGSGSPHPGNLVLEQVLTAVSPPMRKSVLGDPHQFLCVSVCLGIHTLPIDCAFTTQDKVNGSVVVHVTYRVNDPETMVIGVEDALTLLSLRCREAVTDLAETHSFTDISTRHVKEAVEHVGTNDLGLVIKKVLVPDSITWPSEIIKPQSEIVVIRAKAARDEVVTETELAAKKKQAGLIEDKLRSIGITHPVMLMRVLSRYDSDYQTILDAAQHIAESQKSSQDKKTDLLIWFIEQDKVSRTDLYPLVTEVIGQVADGVTSLPDAVTSFITAPAHSFLEASPATPYAVSDITGSEDASEVGELVQPVQEEEGELDSSPIIRRRPPEGQPTLEERKSGHSYIRRKRDPKQ